ncbi:MAG: hypothetical protein WA960_16765 [Tunicatimonas sp.]
MSQTDSPSSGKKNIESYDIANSYETMHLAQDLARFIKENKLFHHIQGKAYVNVEGWQYAGARLGILPVIEELVRIPTDNHEVKYQAQVKLYNLKSQVDGQAMVVGSGYAICSNQENGKRNYQEFAIASMAQTRAIGKAYRNILAWIIRAAGYEPTPAEEMDYMAKDKGAPKKAAKALTKGASATDSAVSEPRPPEDRPPVDRDTAAKKEASVKQKTELLLLLNNKVITNEEKNKMIENINTLDSERATKSIAKLKKVIEERQGGSPLGEQGTTSTESGTISTVADTNAA